MGLPMDLADIVIDWVDPDDVPFPYGAESANYYQTLLPPYNAKNSAMNSIDELLLLKDFTPEVFYGLSENPTEADQKLNDDNRGEIPSLSELMMSKGAGGEFGDDEKNEFIIKKEKSRRLADYLTVYGKRDNHTDEYNKININTASYRVLSALTDNMTDDIVEEMISRRLQEPYKSTSEVKDLVKDEIILKLLSVESHFFTINSTVTIGNSRVSVRTVFNRSTRETHYWSEE
jgi:type II secretory pathway component PulK